MRASLRTATAAAAILVAAACGGGSAGDDREDGAAAPAPEPAAEVTAPAPSPGCDRAATTPVREERRTITVGGVERWYLLTVPEQGGDEPRALVLDIHGLAEGAELHSRMTRYSDLAEQEGFIVAFPHGTGTPVRWDTSVSAGNPDVRYIDALLDEVAGTVCVDESRVYATGLSNGAMMTSALACTMADRFAAVAPVSGVLMPEGCAPARPVPLLAFHGTADPILLFNGGVGDALGRALSGGGSDPTSLPPADLEGSGYPAAVAAWARHDGCDDRPDDEEVTDEVLGRVYRCPRGTAVEFVIVRGGGHSWPSSEFSQGIERIVGHTTFDVDATAEGWRFFERFRRG